jgi:adenosylcobinamide kinase/adenosylcobinamide-phosphate guanylyltransferase
MGKIILILGGARSGKSAYAVESAKRHKKVAFIATCQPLDKEMSRRIRLHQHNRPSHWSTFEESKDLAPLLSKITGKFDCLIIDCLTLWISNLILAGYTQEKILNKINAMMDILREEKAKAIIVSNEVGLGIVPANKLARNFRDIAGQVNKVVAKKGDEVFFTISGIPTMIKGKR